MINDYKITKFFSGLFVFTNNAYTVLSIGLIIFLLIPLVMLFMSLASAKQMVGFKEEDYGQANDERGVLGRFFKGLPYVIGMLVIFILYQVTMESFTSYFKVMVRTHVLSAGAKINYLGSYAFYGSFSILLLYFLFYISNLQRWINVTTILALAPLLF